MILISTGLWDTCLVEPFCCSLALNVNWEVWRGFVCGGGQGEDPGGSEVC